MWKHAGRRALSLLLCAALCFPGADTPLAEGLIDAGEYAEGDLLQEETLIEENEFPEDDAADEWTAADSVFPEEDLESVTEGDSAYDLFEDETETAFDLSDGIEVLTEEEYMTEPASDADTAETEPQSENTDAVITDTDELSDEADEALTGEETAENPEEEAADETGQTAPADGQEETGSQQDPAVAEEPETAEEVTYISDEDPSSDETFSANGDAIEADEDSLLLPAEDPEAATSEEDTADALLIPADATSLETIEVESIEDYAEDTSLVEETVISGEEETEKESEETLIEDETEPVTEGEGILTAEEAFDLQDPTISPEGGSTVASYENFGTLASRGLGAASSFSENFGAQLTGFAKTCYDQRSSYYLSGKTGVLTMQFADETSSAGSPFTFEAKVSGGALQKKSDGYIDLKTSRAVQKGMQSSLDAFCYDYPEIFWTRKGSYSVFYGAAKDKSSSTGYRGWVMSIVYTPDEVFSGASAKTAAFQSAVGKTVSTLISPSYSDVDKDGIVTELEYIYAAHNWICSRVTYARSEYETYCSASSSGRENMNYRIFSPYDVFVGSGGSRVVCEGYARAMKILCDRVGISCICMAGRNHMWNAVRYESVWYLLDATWDDGSTVKYTYFLKAPDGTHAATGNFSGTSNSFVFSYPKLAGSDAVYCLKHKYAGGKCTVCGRKQETVSYKISDVKISSIASVVFTGRAAAPEPVVTYGVTTLKKGKDYTISYTGNTNAGTASVIIKGMGQFTGSRTVNFRITAKTISDLSLSPTASAVYSGGACRPSVTLKYGTAALAEGKDYTLSYADNTNVGTAVITIEGKGNYTGTRKTTFSILPRAISLSANNTIAAQTYCGGAAVKPEPVLYSGEILLKKDVDYTLSWSSNTLPGTGYVTAAGKGNWTGSKTMTFTINTCSVADLAVWVPDVTYTGKRRRPEPVLSSGGAFLVNGRDFIVSYQHNKKIGTAAAVITGIGYYYGTRTVTFRILPKKPKLKKLKSPAKKKITVRWKKVKKAKGYQIQYSTDPTFTTFKMKKAGSGAVSKTLKKLSRKTVYYVRIRSYAKANGETYYSEWSAVRHIKVK